MLFRNISILDVLPDQVKQIKNKIDAFPSDYMLNVSEDDLIASLTDEFTLEAPVLDEASIHLDYGEGQIDISRDPTRMVRDRGRPFYVAGTWVKFIIPFSGDPNLLTVQPQNFSWSARSSDVEIAESEIHITFSSANLSAEGAKREFSNELALIKQNLHNLTVAIDQHNAGLAQLIRRQVQQRKSKLLSDENLAASIGFPIKKREGTAITYSVPIQRRRPRIERPAASSGPFQPEPTLAMAEYGEILTIIRNMVRVMEQSPSAFEKMGEEDLRTHFLVQLNGQFEGRATGETFNFQGKTDIVIKDEGRNVFIAECKFWAGEKAYLETLDQVLSYLSWRDTKVAVLIFSRNLNFSDVLAKIEETTPHHMNFKRTVSKLDESSWQYIFHQPNDRNRELTLTVLAFDVPHLRR